ncbi:MAG: hypothetical protein PHW04_12835 [Candidatus Wallbacteria bacterium]|nr:hypothetical protein [Candidatus Wallbacteria bacterium]
MRITVEFIGAIDRGAYSEIQEFDVADKISVRKFLETLHFKKEQLNFIQVFRHDKRLSHFTLLTQGDSLQLMIPVGGG